MEYELVWKLVYIETDLRFCLDYFPAIVPLMSMLIIVLPSAYLKHKRMK